VMLITALSPLLASSLSRSGHIQQGDQTTSQLLNEGHVNLDPAYSDKSSDTHKTIHNQPHQLNVFCGIRPTSPHSPRFLRGFRSHKNLASTLTPTNQNNSDFTHHPHEMCRWRHKNSPSPDSTEDNRRPSTSSIKSNMSIDWDPLRLHPSNTQGPAPPLPDPVMLEKMSRRQTMPEPHRQHSHATSLRQTASTTTVIYEGFDFGFNNTPTSVLSRTATPTASSAYQRRAPSPTPSDASSECSLALSGSSYDSSLIDDYAAGQEDLEPVGLAPAPAPRSRPRPRPTRQLTSEKDEAEWWLRRGAWKRRGIVFVTPAEYELAGEEETFEF
jgi:hypothetical protein